MNRAIVTVLGSDRVGIIAAVSTRLSELGVNILDTTQTVMKDEVFVLLMLVDLDGAVESFHEISENLKQLGDEQKLSIRIQREKIFDAMHNI